MATDPTAKPAMPATIVGTKSKTYFHRIPGAKFYMPDGRILNFSAGDGSFETTAPEIQLQLDPIADSPSSMIYTKKMVEDIGETKLRHDVEESAKTAFDAANKIPPGTETVPIPTAAPGRPILTPAAVKSAETDTGGNLASKLAQAKAAVGNAGTEKASKPA